VAVNAEVIITVSWLPELTMHAVSAACAESSLSWQQSRCSAPLHDALQLQGQSLQARHSCQHSCCFAVCAAPA
jgi:hypothetical protein